MKTAKLKSKWFKIFILYYRLKYPYDYARFRDIKMQVEINNEKLKIRKEIEEYGHPLITNVIST